MSNEIAPGYSVTEDGKVFSKKRGKTKERYIKHRNACFAEIKRLNDRDGLADMSDDELLAELGI